MEKLHHNGVLVLPRYMRKGLAVRVRGKKIMLTAEQEEMAMAWARKLGTPYVEDQIFVKNFHHDFSQKLGIVVKPGEVDFSEVYSVVEAERNWRASLSRDEKKKLAAQRKTQRETNKERYGYTWVDGAKVEVANYVAEPSCIFMGRGKHPLRGRWKEGPREEDTELNLSPEASVPAGKWKAIIWQPNAMWIARWEDKLSGKMKYVWFSDSSIIKQNKDIAKFEKAKQLRQKLRPVQNHIRENLQADDLRRRKTATVCYLIDKLKIRVGDEKDPDEADTVGASTLRTEHIRFAKDGAVTLNFLGKDSVPHIFRMNLPDVVVNNLKELATNTESTLFDGVGSRHVSEFLDEVVTGLSAKVFRTYYSSNTVESKLKQASLKREDPEYLKKYTATLANLEAAKVCNHKRTIPKTWSSSLDKKEKRLKTLSDHARKAQNMIRRRARDLEKRYLKRLCKDEDTLRVMREKLKNYQSQLTDERHQDKSTQRLKTHVTRQREKVERQRARISALRRKHLESVSKLKQRLENRKQRDRTAMESLKLKIRIQKETRDYNLTTSLKSYIDPRIYYEWGRKVDYDWKRYYPKTLQRKFSWVETRNAQSTSPEELDSYADQMPSGKLNASPHLVETGTALDGL